MRTKRDPLDRAIQILIALGGDDQALDVTTLASRLGLPRSTVYRLLRTLRTHGLINEAPGTSAYRLGSIVLQWASVLQRSLDVVQISAGALRALAQATGETVQLTLLEGERAVTVDVVESPSPVRVAPERGRSLPLYCGASSKAILAHLPEARWHAIVGAGHLAPLTSKTLTSARQLLADLQATRARGYAVSREEVYEGAVGVAAPIFNDRGGVCGSLAISGPIHRLRGRRLQRATTLVQREATALSRALGFRVLRSQRRA